MQKQDAKNSGQREQGLDGVSQVNEDRFRLIVEQSPIAMAIVDMNGVIEFINKKAVEVFGYQHKDIPNMESWWQQSYPNEDYRAVVVNDWMSRVRIAMKNQVEIAGREYYVTCKDGTVKTIFISGVCVPDKVFVLFDDITERKKTVDALAESEERFKRAFEEGPIGMVLTNNELKIVKANKAICEMLGYGAAEILKMTLNEISCAEDLQQDSVSLKKLLNSEITDLRSEKRYVKKNGNVIWVRATLSVLNDKDERFVNVMALIEDITKRKHAEETLHKTQRLESLAVLAGGIAHDFNNLLTGIFGGVDLARNNCRDSTINEYLDITLATLPRAKALTRQLLTFAKGGAPIKESTELPFFIRETAKFALSGSNISITFSFDDDLWSCNVDRNQISQVIDNVVINAQQSMPNGGNIEILARNISFAIEEHAVLNAGSYVEISIKDFGVGIPYDIISKVFDPFYTTKTKGHGLGLATCYSIVNRHDGHIEVESAPGKGSTFIIYLPASFEPIATDEIKPKTHKGSGTIIVIDDEDSVSIILRKMLEKVGYTVECKSNGKQGVDFYIEETKRNKRIVAIITDLTIPGGMGGVEVVSEIRKLNKSIPIFVVSGYADDSAIIDPVKYGFTDSISKPFTLTDLLGMLDKYLGKAMTSTEME